jgi:hypothetical protein
MSYASLGKTYLITPLRKQAPIHIVSCDDISLCLAAVAVRRSKLNLE